jgi:YfiR/HmsC-like
MGVLEMMAKIKFRIRQKILLAIIVLFPVFVASAANAEESKKEASYYELQANLIYNFINHLSWERPADPKIICIIGDNPIMPYVQSVTEADPHISVKRKYEDDFIDDCSILFVNRYFKGHFKKLLLKAGNKPILTISDIEYFAQNGGIVQFALRQNRVELAINKKSLRRARIQISSAILASSEIIN